MSTSAYRNECRLLRGHANHLKENWLVAVGHIRYFDVDLVQARAAKPGKVDGCLHSADKNPHGIGQRRRPLKHLTRGHGRIRRPESRSEQHDDVTRFRRSQVWIAGEQSRLSDQSRRVRWIRMHPCDVLPSIRAIRIKHEEAWAKPPHSGRLRRARNAVSNHLDRHGAQRFVGRNLHIQLRRTDEVDKSRLLVDSDSYPIQFGGEASLDYLVQTPSSGG